MRRLSLNPSRSESDEDEDIVSSSKFFIFPFSLVLYLCAEQNLKFLTKFSQFIVNSSIWLSQDTLIARG